MAHLDSDVVRTVPTEGVPKHLVNCLRSAVDCNVDHRRRGALADVANLLRRRSVSDGEDEQVLHAVHRREVALVVEDVRDGGCRRIVHDEAAVDGWAGGLSVDGGETEGLEEARRGRRGAAHLPELEVETRRLGRVGSGEHERRRTLEVKARDEQRLNGVLQGKQCSFLFSREHLLQNVVHALRRESPAPAEDSGGFEPIELVVSVGDEADGVSSGVERPAEAVVGGDHGSKDGADARAGDDVEEIGDLSVGIGGVGADLVLEVDEGGAGDGGGGASAVDAENAGFCGGFVVGEPLLLQFGEDL